MKNTLKNKMKFFAQYYGQKIKRSYLPEQHELGELNGQVFHIAHLVINGYLELRPIAQMTLEEGQKFLDTFFKVNSKCKVYNIIVIPEKAFIIEFKYPDNETPEDEEGYSYSSVTIDAERTSYEHIDWLRYHGFAVSWMGLDVPQLQEYGWIKLKEDDSHDK